MIVVETDRLFVRHVHVADLEAMAALFADPEVMHFGPGLQTREWTRTWLRGCLEDYHEKWGFGLWAVVHREDSSVIGYCGLTRHEALAGAPEIEIGYRLKPAYWGRGLATEAARAVVDHAFRVLCLARLVAVIDP